MGLTFDSTNKLTKNQADVFKSQKEVREVYNKAKKGTMEE